MTEAWIIDACRTPRGIGKVGKGSLAHLHTQRLGATVLAAIAERTGIDTARTVRARCPRYGSSAAGALAAPGAGDSSRVGGCDFLETASEAAAGDEDLVTEELDAMPAPARVDLDQTFFMASCIRSGARSFHAAARRLQRGLRFGPSLVISRCPESQANPPAT